MKPGRIFQGIVLATAVLLFITSCGVSKDEVDKLKADNERLKTELEELKYGAERIIASVEKAYAEKNFILAKQNIEILYEKHPESPKNKEFAALLKEIEKEEIIERNRKQAEEKEQTRLANLNNTGMWSVRYYVDEFKERTKTAYITNTVHIKGTFSNTATQNSELTVDFLVDSATDISIQLYEYADNNPVKAVSSDSYRVLIQDKDGNRLTLRAVNSSDRLRLGKQDAISMHNALMKGGTIKFKIYEIGTPTTEYEFILKNADWYENAFRILKES